MMARVSHDSRGYSFHQALLGTAKEKKILGLVILEARAEKRSFYQGRIV